MKNPKFADEETEAKKVTNLLKETELVSSRVRMETQ